MFIDTLICLIILTSQCVCVHSKVIIVNSNNGNDNTECCVNGECACSSLSTALLNIDNNTIINITSQSVALNNTTTMGSGKLTNITITGSNVTIMCNNSGSVYCESCDDVMIEGITWDRCGDPNGANIAGVTFNGTSNILLVNCTFQHSQGPAVALLEISDIILIQGCNFLSNALIKKAYNDYGILSITKRFAESLTITIIINESHFRYNGDLLSLKIDIKDYSVTIYNVIFNKTTFISNRKGIYINFDVAELFNVQLIQMLVLNNSVSDNVIEANAVFYIYSFSHTNKVLLSISSSNFTGNNGSNVLALICGDTITVRIIDSHFTNNKGAAGTTVEISPQANKVLEVSFYNVEFNNNVMKSTSSNQYVAGIASIYTPKGNVKIYMHKVRFKSNQYLGNYGGALYISGNDDTQRGYHIIVIKECEFVNNRSPGHGAAVYIGIVNFHRGQIEITNTIFYQNLAGSSIVYISQDFIQFKALHVSSITLTNNVGSSLYLVGCDLCLSGMSLFKNNTAENGAAMYLTKGTTFTTENEVTVQFVANTATFNGGAIYVDLVSDQVSNEFSCYTETFDNIIVQKYNSVINFTNNTAMIAGNSLYFNVPRSCSFNTNINDSDCILHVPCQFNYSQPVNGKMMNISCDFDYTVFNGTGAPIVTSPHELRLYFPFNDGYKISPTSDHNIYFVRNNILGRPVKFTGAVFDYFGKLANPTQFSIQPLESECSAYSLLNAKSDHHVLTESIDNITVVSISFLKKEGSAVHNTTNLTITLKSLFYSLNKINATLTVELVPCINHPGYTYSKDLHACVCYHDNVKCYDDGNEIKRGYWFGSIASKATTSLCPNHYCKFTEQKQTTEGYFELPNTTNAQCNDYRVGRACGECSSGYTLSYDSTDCISVDQCGTGWTVLVITLTCLYWIAVVAGVFSLMYLKRHISLGYLYGIIYYYSMVDIMLDNNPYILDGVFYFISVLSSFAQLTPRFLGKLCLVKGLSGIDQLFIHYSHAVGVSLLLLLIVVAARCSARISFFVSRCIIRVICLLILLSYTSIASTSLQLLQPLRFTEVEEVYTYSSPDTQYFHERHVVYGAVAIICELVVGIGLPVLLLFEPVLRKKINFIKIKPLLDQFQGCYKDKYHYFAAYYLICRQVIFLIVYSLSINYYNMLFYLQTACVIIAMIHIWIQPYQSDFLNALDGVLLLLIVLEVNINTFPFLKSMITEISLILVLFPLVLFGIMVMKNVFKLCFKRLHYHHYVPVNNDDVREANVVIRNAGPINDSDEPTDYEECNDFREPLLNFASNNDS